MARQGIAPAAEFATNTPSRRNDFAPKIHRPQQSAIVNQQPAAASIASRYSNNVRNTETDGSVLGSGNFILIRGGTFDLAGGSLFSNGFGREAQASKTSRKEPFYPANPFDKFKDFADIAGDPAYSHVVNVYNDELSATRKQQQPKIMKTPKNIFEQLQLIDKENEEISKLSKTKSKLMKTKFADKKKFGSKFESKSNSDSYVDPLMAVNWNHHRQLLRVYWVSLWVLWNFI